MRDENARIAGAFLIGGIIGAAVALLYAPKSGRETRRDISKAAKRIRNDAVELVEETIRSVNDFAGDVREKAAEIVERGVELSDAAKKEIVKSLEQGQRVIEKQKKRIIEGLGL